MLGQSLLTIWKEFGPELVLRTDGPVFRPQPGGALSCEAVGVEVEAANIRLLWVPGTTHRSHAWDIGNPSAKLAWASRLKAAYLPNSALDTIRAPRTSAGCASVGQRRR